MFFPLSTIKKFHVEIVFVAWLRDLSWEVKIFFPFFLKRHLQKVLYPSVILFACFLTANIICICHYFRWLSWPFLRARASKFIYSTLSSFFAWCRAWVCRSGSKDICPLQHGFLCFLLFLYLYFYSPLCIITHIWFFFPRRVPLDLEIGYEKSILTRTETFFITIFFREPLLFITLFLKRIYFYLPFTSISTWN